MHDCISLKVAAQNGSLNFNNLPVVPRGGREEGTHLLEW